MAANKNPHGVRREVPNDELREAVLRAVERGDSFTDIARRMGYVQTKVTGDTTRLKIMLGLRPNSKRGARYRQETVEYGTAVRLVEVLGIDPVDVGV